MIGALAGTALPFVSKRYRARTRLAEFKITVPQVSELRFVVDDGARQVAWQLYVEVTTRIATQPLADDEGFLREALASLYGLFATTRATLKAGRPSVPAAAGAHTVEYLAVTMLNRELRPFLAKWHPRLNDFEREHAGEPESAWPQSAECRRELQRVRQNTMAYALGFARLAGVHDAAAMFAP